MKVEFLSRFAKDLEKIDSKKVRDEIIKLIEQFELSTSLRDIEQVKKLKGHKTAHRIRVDDYRVVIFFEKNVVEFARVLHRKDIYKSFP